MPAILALVNHCICYELGCFPVDKILREIWDVANARGRNVGGAERIRDFIIASNTGDVKGYARYCTQHWAISIVSSIYEEKPGALMETQGHPLQMSRRTLLWAILHG